MRPGRWLVGAAVAVTLGMGPSLRAERPVSVAVTSDLYGQYVWRGQRLNKEPVFQPGATVTARGLTAGVWGNMDLTDIHDERYAFTEVDYSLGYAGSLPGTDKWSYSAGFIYYDLSLADLKTLEVYAGLTWNVPLSPSVTVYYDVDKDEAGDPDADDLTRGTYVVLGLAHTLEAVIPWGDSALDIKLGAGLGWGDSAYNRGYWGVDGGRLNDLDLSVAVPLEVCGMTITPSVKVFMLLDGDIRDSDVYSDDNAYVLAGVGLTKTF